MVRGRLDPKASTATGYAWIVWTKRSTSKSQLVWIPPCRKRLERLTDYSPCPFRKSYPDVLVVQSSQDGNGGNGARSLDRSMQRRIFP